MIPTFELFGKTFSVYTVLALMGIFSGGIYACKKAKAHGFNDNDMIEFLLAGGFAALIGGHLLYGITNLSAMRAFFSNLSEISSASEFFHSLFLLFGGSVFYGGLIAGMGAAAVYAHVKKMPLSDFSDIAAPSVAVMHFFGRIGCFLGGCCYGVESSIGFVYTHSLIAQANGVRRFPIQLAEAFYELFLFFLLASLLKNGRLKGRLFYLYLLLYSPVRFALEFFRGDAYRGFLFGLSTSQLISIGVFLFSLFSFYVKTKAGQKTYLQVRQFFRPDHS